MICRVSVVFIRFRRDVLKVRRRSIPVVSFVSCCYSCGSFCCSDSCDIPSLLSLSPSYRFSLLPFPFSQCLSSLSRLPLISSFPISFPLSSLLPRFCSLPLTFLSSSCFSLLSFLLIPSPAYPPFHTSHTSLPPPIPSPLPPSPPPPIPPPPPSSQVARTASAAKVNIGPAPPAPLLA